MKKEIQNIVIPLICLFVGIIGTVLVYKYTPQTIENGVIETKNVNITTNESIHEAVNKIYDSVIVVQNYINGNLYGTGSGLVYKVDDNYGYIITNQHVIDKATEIKVTNNNSEEKDAKLLGADQYFDIAVLRVDKDFVMSVAQIGDSSQVNIGDTVFAVGCPMGIEYQGTVTKGILSNTKREVEVKLSSGGSYIMEVLQTDAAINPGNSGGPLVNMNGEVIGINSMKLIEEKIENMGFAVPIEAAMSAVEYLEVGKEIERPIMGITNLDITNQYLLYRYGINVDSNIKYGVVIVYTEDGYPAAKAGIQKGDVIIQINDDKITSSAKLRAVLYKYKVGDTITVTYIRNGETKTASILLDKSA